MQVYCSIEMMPTEVNSLWYRLWTCLEKTACISIFVCDESLYADFRTVLQHKKNPKNLSMCPKTLTLSGLVSHKHTRVLVRNAACKHNFRLFRRKFHKTPQWMDVICGFVGSFVRSEKMTVLR